MKTARSLVWPLLAIAIVLPLRSDRSSAPAPHRVVFLGKGAAPQEPAYQRLARELRSRHAALASQIDLVFALDSDDPGQLADTLRHITLTNPSLIIAPNARAAMAVRQHAPSIPLVFGSFADPVEFRIISSLQQRSEPATGVWISDDLDGKRLELLRDAYPHIKSVVIMGDRDWGRNVQAEAKLPSVAHDLGIDLAIVYAESADEALALLGDARFSRYDAWCFPRTVLTMQHSMTYVRLLASRGKPTMLADTKEVISGAPLSYALDTGFAWPAIADLTARILEGEAAEGIPVERPPKYILAVRANGYAGLPPPSAAIMRRADLVVR